MNGFFILHFAVLLYLINRYKIAVNYAKYSLCSVYSAIKGSQKEIVDYNDIEMRMVYAMRWKGICELKKSLNIRIRLINNDMLIGF